MHIHDEIIAENLKSVWPMKSVDFVFYTIHRMQYHLFYFWQNLASKVKVLVVLLHVVLKHVERQLVSVFKLPVFFRMFLDRVIGKVHERVQQLHWVGRKHLR